MIKIRNLCKKYKKEDKYIIQNLNLDLPDTGTVTIIGKSGSGKSTLLRLIGLIDLDYEGSIKINGIELKSMTNNEMSNFRFQNIGFSFQKEEFDESMTVKENLSWQLKITNLDKSSEENAIDSILNLVNLKEKKNELIKNLSGGERKRVGIARALINNPNILILDEPFASIDDQNRSIIIKTLNVIARTSLVIVVTHSNDRLENDTLIECVDGNFQIKEDKREFYKIMKVKIKVRKRYSFFNMIKKSLKTFRGNKIRYLLVLFGLIISNTCFGMSFYLSSSVKETISNTLKGTIDNNSLEIVKDNPNIIDDSLYGTNIDISEKICSDYSNYVTGYGVYYYGNFEQLFDNKNCCYITLNNKNKINLNSISIRNFINPLRDYEENIKVLNLKNDEIVLMLKQSDYDALEKMLGIYSIDQYIEKYGLYLNLEVGASIMQYSADIIFKIVKIIVGVSAEIIVNNAQWNIQFLNKELKLEQYNNLEIDSDIPWKIKCCSYLSLKHNTFLEFYESFVKDNKYSSYLIEKINFNKDRYAVIVDNIVDIKLSEINEICNKFEDNINSVIVSNSAFGFLADGRYCGFSKPLFLSLERQELNRLADVNYQSKLDLNVFQGAMFEVEEGVYKCDLISSVKTQDGIKYKVLSKDDYLLEGQKPKSIDEILISSNLATKLFLTNKDYLNAKISGLILLETVQSQEEYINKFKDVEFRITGVIDSKEDAIYQSSIFPTAFLIDRGNLKASDSRCTGALINFNSLLDHDLILNYMKVSFPNFECSFPGEIIENGINEAIYFVNIFLVSFSAFTMFISLGMLSFAMNILISKEKRKIGIYLTYGYHNIEIFETYFTSILLLVFNAFISSVFNVIFVSLYETLMYEKTVYSFESINPIVYITMALFSIFSLMIGALHIHSKIRDYTPFECFKTK